MKLVSIVFISIAFLISACSSNENQTNLELSGTIETTNVVISSKVAGEISSINVKEGDSIEIGDTLLIIDHENYEIQKAQAEAALMGAKASYQLLKNGARKEDISSAKEMYSQAKANFELSESDFTRFKNLYDQKVITKKQFEEISTRYEISKSQLNQAEQNLKKIENFARPEEINAAQARENQAKASYDLINKLISDCFVVSPISGIVTEKYVEKGETAVPQTSLLQISNLSKVEIYVYVAEANLGKIKLGEKAEIKIDTFSEKVYDGKVTYISSEAEFTPKTIQTKDERTKLVFAIKVEAENKDFELKSGLPADVKIYFK